jgi:hypothetical protein
VVRFVGNSKRNGSGNSKKQRQYLVASASPLLRPSAERKPLRGGFRRKAEALLYLEAPAKARAKQLQRRNAGVPPLRAARFGRDDPVFGGAPTTAGPLRGDNQKGMRNGKDHSRSPSGMTTRKARVTAKAIVQKKKRQPWAASCLILGWMFMRGKVGLRRSRACGLTRV